jgi:hypothetical protein
VVQTHRLGYSQFAGLDGLDDIAKSDSNATATPLGSPHGRPGPTVGDSKKGVVGAEGAWLALSRDGLLADTIWNIPALLELTDSVRWSVTMTKTLGPLESRLTALLDVVLSNEALRSSPSKLLVGIETIRGARLDKLVEALLDRNNQPPRPVPASFFAAKTAAGVLQRKWRLRFRDGYTSLDRVRYHRMLTSGHLMQVSFSAAVAGVPDSPALWKTQECEPLVGAGGDRQFSAGQYVGLLEHLFICTKPSFFFYETLADEPRWRSSWWLNIVCAHRDGVVGTTSQAPMKGQDGIAALPLLSGREEVMENGQSVYIRESSRVSDTHISLMTQVGQQIRILRGCQLRSIYAPSGGLRYDGL